MRCFPALTVLVAGVLLGTVHSGAAEKEYLTSAEIEKIQDTHEIDLRVKLLLDAGTLRLRTAQERLTGKEAEPGDPLELFSVEDLLDGYHRIVRSVMFTLDDAVQKPVVDKVRFPKALKALKDSAEHSLKELALLKQMVEDKRLEEPWNLVNKGIDITQGALDGAVEALAKEPKAAPKKKRD
jgi:hypothetical protein